MCCIGFLQLGGHTSQHRPATRGALIAIGPRPSLSTSLTIGTFPPVGAELAIWALKTSRALRAGLTAEAFRTVLALRACKSLSALVAIGSSKPRVGALSTGVARIFLCTLVAVFTAKSLEACPTTAAVNLAVDSLATRTVTDAVKTSTATHAIGFKLGGLTSCKIGGCPIAGSAPRQGFIDISITVIVLIIEQFVVLNLDVTFAIHSVTINCTLRRLARAYIDGPQSDGVLGSLTRSLDTPGLG